MNVWTSGFVRSLLAIQFSLFKRQAGQGKKNGELLRLATGSFEVFITVDRNLYFQQNITDLKIVVAVLKAPTNRAVDLKALAPTLLARLPELKPGQIVVISRP
jgi:hypothetical protein